MIDILLLDTDIERSCLLTRTNKTRRLPNPTIDTATLISPLATLFFFVVSTLALHEKPPFLCDISRLLTVICAILLAMPVAVPFPLAGEFLGRAAMVAAIVSAVLRLSVERGEAWASEYNVNVQT